MQLRVGGYCWGWSQQDQAMMRCTSPLNSTREGKGLELMTLTGFRELLGGAPQPTVGPSQPSRPEHFSLPLAAYLCPLSYPLMNW